MLLWVNQKGSIFVSVGATVVSSIYCVLEKKKESRTLHCSLPLSGFYSHTHEFPFLSPFVPAMQPISISAILTVADSTVVIVRFLFCMPSSSQKEV